MAQTPALGDAERTRAASRCAEVFAPTNVRLHGHVQVGVERQTVFPRSARFCLKNRKLFFRLTSKFDRLLSR